MHCCAVHDAFFQNCEMHGSWLREGLMLLHSEVVFNIHVTYGIVPTLYQYKLTLYMGDISL